VRRHATHAERTPVAGKMRTVRILLALPKTVQRAAGGVCAIGAPQRCRLAFELTACPWGISASSDRDARRAHGSWVHPGAVIFFFPASVRG
jgi:hypothetical protein